MAHKKKPKKGKHQRAKVPPLDESKILSVLESLEDSDPLDLVRRISDASSAVALIERLPLEDTSVPLLMALHERFPDKPVRKSLKRTLFKLKQKGISVPDMVDDSQPFATAVQQVPAQKPVARVGFIGDLIGSRPVIFIIDHAAMGQDLGIGLVSDEEGIPQFLYGTFSRRKVRELINSIMEGAGPLVDTTLSHALTILETAYHQHQERHPEIPTDYLELRPWLLDHANPLDQPIIYDHIPEGSLSDPEPTPSQVEKLLEHDFLKPWLVDFEQLKPFMEDMVKAGGSPIVLTEAQRSERIQEIKERSIEVLFPRGKRASLKHRLEETSYLFFQLGNQEMSRLSLQAARTMDHDDTLLRKNPVVTYLLERSLRLYMKEPDREASDPSLPAGSSPRIIVP